MEPTTTLATEIADKSTEQFRILLGRNWPEVSRILGKDEEITLGFAVKITNRTAMPGEHADKDNRLKFTLGFSEKFSDSTEAVLDDNQLELSYADAANTPESNTTAIGAALNTAAAGTEQPLLDFDINFAAENYGSLTECAKAFKAAAKTAKWSAPAISLVNDQLKSCATVEDCIAVIRPHVKTVEAPAAD